jgi:hypothetical protein
MGVRPDGATRGDLAEATALVVGGLILLPVPLLVFFDRLAMGWFWGSLAFAAVGLASAALGLRWFLKEGPALIAAPPDDVGLLHGGGVVELPQVVRLVEARSRLIAHVLRFSAIGSGVLLVIVSLGPLKWVVLALFGASFVADQTLLPPHKWVVDAQGLRRSGVFGTDEVRWTDVGAVFWKHYPEGINPPFPSGERLIIERSGGEDLELVFHRRQNGTDAAFFVRTIAPLIGDKLQVLLPRDPSRPRTELDAQSMADVLASTPVEPPE